MARKPNYNFEKRAKEEARKAKKDAKQAEKLQRKRDGAGGDGAEPDATVPADDEASA
jgi:hypothetical protein